MRVRERDYDAAGHGGTLWGSAVGLAIYIARHRRLFAGKTVLELGSGLGLCGIACAKAGRPEVCVLTDWGGSGGAAAVPPLNQQYDAVAGVTDMVAVEAHGAWPLRSCTLRGGVRVCMCLCACVCTHI